MSTDSTRVRRRAERDSRTPWEDARWHPDAAANPLCREPSLLLGCIPILRAGPSRGLCWAEGSPILDAGLVPTPSLSPGLANMWTGGSSRQLPRAKEGKEAQGERPIWDRDVRSEPGFRVEPSLSSQRSTHLETGPRTDQFRLALPCLSCSRPGASWWGAGLFYNRGREPGQAKGWAPDPWAPLLLGHSTRVLRGKVAQRSHTLPRGPKCRG